jgi:hypothetical protein
MILNLFDVPWKTNALRICVNRSLYICVPFFYMKLKNNFLIWAIAQICFIFFRYHFCWCLWLATFFKYFFHIIYIKTVISCGQSRKSVFIFVLPLVDNHANQCSFLFCLWWTITQISVHFCSAFGELYF